MDSSAPGCDFGCASGTDGGYNVQIQSGSAVYSEMARSWCVSLRANNAATRGPLAVKR